MARWAFIYEHPDADSERDSFRVDRGGQITELVPVKDVDQAVAVAVDLTEQGVGLIELCGGFDTRAVARVVDAVRGKAAVGHVTYGAESLEAAARYAQMAAKSD